MNVVFRDKVLEELYETGKVKGRYKYICNDHILLSGYRRAVDSMKEAADIGVLKSISYLHYEKLKYQPESSVRIVNGKVERLIFIENENGIEVKLIEIDNKHYGRKL